MKSWNMMNGFFVQIFLRDSKAFPIFFILESTSLHVKPAPYLNPIYICNESKYAGEQNSRIVAIYMQNGDKIIW
jgi:hypothetical protein